MAQSRFALFFLALLVDALANRQRRARSEFLSPGNSGGGAYGFPSSSASAPNILVGKAFFAPPNMGSSLPLTQATGWATPPNNFGAPQGYEVSPANVNAGSGFDVDAAYKVLVAQQQTLQQMNILQQEVRQTAITLANMERKQREQLSFGGPLQGQLASLLQAGRNTSSAMMPFLLSLTSSPGDSNSMADVLQDYYTSSTFALVGASVVIWAVLTFLTACIYSRKKNHPPDQQPGNHNIVPGKWKFHYLQCLHDISLTSFTCCCPAARWSDNMRMAHIFSFWGAFALFMILSVCTILGAGLTAVLLLGLLVYGRQKIRFLFDINPCSCSSILEDCLTYIFCSVCVIVQEARQLEAAYQFQHPAVMGNQQLHGGGGREA